MYKMCPGRIVKNKFSKITADTKIVHVSEYTSSSIVHDYIADKTDRQILHSCTLLTI